MTEFGCVFVSSGLWPAEMVTEGKTMKNAVLVVLDIALGPAYAFGVDGVTLINQSTVIAAGGFPYTISRPGSYKLSGNLTVPTGVDGNQDLSV
jgi:hypothetical protein